MEEIKLLEYNLNSPDIDLWRPAFLSIPAGTLTKPIVFSFSCVKCGKTIELADTECPWCNHWNTWKEFTTATC
jgi:lipopolysaccharide biosynthesis regulator YciM